MTIDPGVEIGWAMWATRHGDNGKPKQFKRVSPPLAAGECIPYRSKGVRRLNAGTDRGANDYVLRAMGAVDLLRESIDAIGYEPVLFLVEWPRFFGGSFGQGVAERGDLVKLSFSVGLIAGLATEYEASFQVIGVNTWKGQLPKSVVESRVTYIIGGKGWVQRLGLRPGSHAFDAIGIGCHLRGIKF